MQPEYVMMSRAQGERFAKGKPASGSERHQLTDALGRLAAACNTICGAEAEFIGITKELESAREDALWLVRYADKPDVTAEERGLRCAQAILSALTWLTPKRG